MDCVNRVIKSRYDKEIIIVNDGSSDHTQGLIENLSSKHKEIRIFTHDKNRGKGVALSTGLKHVTGDIVVFQDADLEYNPEDYGSLLAPIELGMADAAYGSRSRGGSYSRSHLFLHMVGNRFLTTFSNMLTNLNLTDMETGYKAFNVKTAKSLNIKSHSFAVEPEITAKLSKMNLRIYEVPISYEGRNYNSEIPGNCGDQYWSYLLANGVKCNQSNWWGLARIEFELIARSGKKSYFPHLKC